MTNQPLRIVQWTSGNVARQAIRTIVERPDLELVGVFAYSPDKVGRDAGELARMDATLGVVATDDIDDILALEPDCVSYMPLTPDIDVMTTLLRAGINIVTTSEFLTGAGHDKDAIEALEQAAREGDASVFGSGVNPGWISCVAAVASSPSRSVDLVRITESYDLSLMAADANMDDFGWGRPAGDAGHARDIEEAVYEFHDAADLTARLFGVTLDDLRCEVRFVHATEDLDVSGRDVAAGTVAGIEVIWTGTAAGRDVIELVTRWAMTSKLDGELRIDNGYHVQVIGDPGIDLRLAFVPHESARTMEDFLAIGNRVTAMPAINAIPSVVAAPAGIVTYADLTPITAPITGPEA